MMYIPDFRRYFSILDSGDKNKKEGKKYFSSLAFFVAINVN
jgi:hypothetical protein